MTLRDRDVPIVIGGGYGLLLRQRYVAESRLRTLRMVPSARSTEDLDVFLTAEVIADTGRVRSLRDALSALGYEAIPGAEYYQFGRDVDYLGQRRRVKIDLLASLPDSDQSRRRLKIKNRRVRPLNVRGIHAHTSPAAVTVAEHLLPIKLSREDDRVTVYIPHPFTFLMLKLHAYRDRRDDETVNYGRHHAADLYRTLAMTTEPEWQEAEALRDRYSHTDAFQEAGRAAHILFKSETARGMLALQEHGRSTGVLYSGSDMAGFLRDLHELFPAPAGLEGPA